MFFNNKIVFTKEELQKQEEVRKHGLRIRKMLILQHNKRINEKHESLFVLLYNSLSSYT